MLPSIDLFTADSLPLEHHSRSLYYKTLRSHNLREDDRFCGKLVTFGFDKEQTNLLDYYGVRRLRIHNVFTIQTRVTDIFCVYSAGHWQERLVGDTHSSLFWTFVGKEEEKSL